MIGKIRGRMIFSLSGGAATDRPYRSSFRMNASLLLLSFVVLVAVLAYNTRQQWQAEQQHFAENATHTVENYSAQMDLLRQSGFHANRLFIHNHLTLLEQYLFAQTAQNDQQLWDDMQRAFFNLTGFFVFNDQGLYLKHQGIIQDQREITDIASQVQAQKTSSTSSGVFSLRYGGNGSFYIHSHFVIQQQSYWLVVRRPYSKFSQIVYEGGFPGFELAIIDRQSNRISIRERYFASSHSQPVLQPEEQQRIISRAPLHNTPWDLVALAEEKEQQTLLWRHIREPLMVFAVLLLLVCSLWIYMLRYDLRSQRLEAIRRETEARADKTLMSIDDALIATDEHGVINYTNPKGAALLRANGASEFHGKQLSDAWSDPQALWNRGLEIAELELLHETGHRLTADIGDEQRIFEQRYNPLYNADQIDGVVWLLRDITETEQAIKALSASQLRYKALFEEAGVAHCLIDISQYQGQLSDLVLISANESAVRLTQARDLPYLLEHGANMVESSAEEYQQALKRALALNLETTEFEMQLTTFAGNTIDIWVNLSLRSGAENIALMTLLDITERNRIARETQEREHFWSNVMAAMPDLVYVIDLDEQLQQTILFGNRRLGEMLGYSKDDSNTTLWQNMVHPDDIAALPGELKIRRTLLPGQTQTSQVRMMHQDGSIRVIKFYDTPFNFDQHGNVTRYIGTARDVTEEVEAQEIIIDSERRYRLLAENINDIIWATDQHLTFNFVSSSVEKTLGYKPDELLREGVFSVFQHSDLNALIKTMKRRIKEPAKDPDFLPSGDDVIRQDMVAFCKSGEEKILEIEASLLWNEDGELQGISGISRDVTEARQLEKELHLAAEVFQSSNEAILITDKNLNIASTNTAFSQITGYDVEDIIGNTPDFLISPEHHDASFFEDIGKSLVVDGYWSGELFFRHADQTMHTGWAGVSAIRDEEREIQSLIVIMSDITDRKAIEERIHKLAYFDPLTGLPNRSQLHERLETMLQQTNHQQQAVALLFIDLDRFKPINDSMGHPAGDQVLKEVAERLRHCIKKQDLVCRIGGDEFTIAISGQKNGDTAADTAVKVGERILHALHQPFKLGQREVFISASIGISIYPDDSSSVIELLKSSDMAMYHAKEQGRDNVQFFNQKMNQKAVELLELENDLRHALKRNELELYFQPQYRCSDSQVVGAEVLLRWQHPQKGFVSPGVFIPIMEDTGLIIPIGQWVLEQACQHFSRWQQQGYNIERIAVNVSALQFKQDNFVEQVTNAILKAGIQASQLELELTESILIDNLQHTLDVLNALSELGVQTAIDDFGTGYSSLNYLKQFPVDTLKIDQSFIRNLPDNNDDAQITRTIIAMAHNLGMGVIAEGVETQQQLVFLQQAECEEVQGFYFSKPVPEPTFREFLHH